MGRSVMMATDRHNQGAGFTDFNNLSTCDLNLSNVENLQNPKFRTAGILSNLYARVFANDRATSTLTVRRNLANGNQSVSITGSTTGEFSDKTNFDTVASGDTLDYQLVTGAGGTIFSISVIAISFNANDKTIVKYAVTNGFSYVGVTTRYNSIGGYQSGTLTESNVQYGCGCAGTLLNMSANLDGNPGTGVTTITSRKNTANGNLSISIAANGTGLFEDTTHSDTIAIGDKINTVISVTGTANPNVDYIAIEFATTDNTWPALAAEEHDGQSFGSTFYEFFSGGMNSNTPESTFQLQIGIACTISSLYIVADTNSINGTTTMTLRKNGVSTPLTVSIGSTATGIFQDTTDVVACVAADEVNYTIVAAGTSGSIAYNLFGTKITPVAGNTRGLMGI